MENITSSSFVIQQVSISKKVETDEFLHEIVGGLFQHRARSSDLSDLAAIHNRHPIPEPHCFHHIMRNEDDGFAELSHPGCPWLVVQGDEDELVNIDEVRAWVESMEPSPDLVVMEQADHFFHRRLMDLRGLLKNGVRDQLPLDPDQAA